MSKELSKQEIAEKKSNLDNAITKYDNAISSIDTEIILLTTINETLSDKKNFCGLTYVTDTIKYIETTIDDLKNVKTNLNNAISSVRGEINKLGE